jgi:hypothetical protein
MVKYTHISKNFHKLTKWQGSNFRGLGDVSALFHMMFSGQMTFINLGSCFKRRSQSYLSTTLPRRDLKWSLHERLRQPTLVILCLMPVFLYSIAWTRWKSIDAIEVTSSKISNLVDLESFLRVCQNWFCWWTAIWLISLRATWIARYQQFCKLHSALWLNSRLINYPIVSYLKWILGVVWDYRPTCSICFFPSTKYFRDFWTLYLVLEKLYDHQMIISWDLQLAFTKGEMRREMKSRKRMVKLSRVRTFAPLY